MKEYYKFPRSKAFVIQFHSMMNGVDKKAICVLFGLKVVSFSVVLHDWKIPNGYTSLDFILSFTYALFAFNDFNHVLSIFQLGDIFQIHSWGIYSKFTVEFTYVALFCRYLCLFVTWIAFITVCSTLSFQKGWRLIHHSMEGRIPPRMEAQITLQHIHSHFVNWQLRQRISEQIVFWVKEVLAESIKGD